MQNTSDINESLNVNNKWWCVNAERNQWSSNRNILNKIAFSDYLDCTLNKISSMYIADVFGVWNIVQVLNYTEELFMTLWLPYVYISQRLEQCRLCSNHYWNVVNPSLKLRSCTCKEHERWPIVCSEIGIFQGCLDCFSLYAPA